MRTLGAKRHPDLPSSLLVRGLPPQGVCRRLLLWAWMGVFHRNPAFLAKSDFQRPASRRRHARRGHRHARRRHLAARRHPRRWRRDCLPGRRRRRPARRDCRHARRRSRHARRNRCDLWFSSVFGGIEVSEEGRAGGAHDGSRWEAPSSERTHRGWRQWPGAPAGRMEHRPTNGGIMRPAGARLGWLADRWVRLSLRSSLPTGYPHWPRWGREARQPSSHSTENSGEPDL